MRSPSPLTCDAGVSGEIGTGVGRWTGSSPSSSHWPWLWPPPWPMSHSYSPYHTSSDASYWASHQLDKFLQARGGGSLHIQSTLPGSTHRWGQTYKMLWYSLYIEPWHSSVSCTHFRICDRVVVTSNNHYSLAFSAVPKYESCHRSQLDVVFVFDATHNHHLGVIPFPVFISNVYFQFLFICDWNPNI